MIHENKGRGFRWLVFPTTLCLQLVNARDIHGNLCKQQSNPLASRRLSEDIHNMGDTYTVNWLPIYWPGLVAILGCRLNLPSFSSLNFIKKPFSSPPPSASPPLPLPLLTPPLCYPTFSV